MQQYEAILLSDLFKQSRFTPHPDYILALNFIYHRLDLLMQSNTQSQFNTKAKWFKRLLPRWLLPKLLYRFRYDAMIGFVTTEESRKIFGMVSFQKHPRHAFLGMFDVYITPEQRGENSTEQFNKLSDLMLNIIHYYKDKNYKYCQCGHNITTQKILRLFKRYCKNKKLNIPIDIQSSKIYIDDSLFNE